MIEVPTGRVCGTHWPGLGSVRGVLGAMPGQDTQKNQGRVLVGKLKWATLKPLSLDGRTESTLQTHPSSRHRLPRAHEGEPALILLDPPGSH